MFGLFKENINGLYFNPEDEVDDFEYRLSKDLERIYKEKGITYIKLDFDNKDDYYTRIYENNKYKLRESSDNYPREGKYRCDTYDVKESFTKFNLSKVT